MCKNNPENSLQIRQFQKSDQEEVIKLWHRCDLVVPWSDPVKDIAAKLSFQRELFFVGLIDGKVVASAMAGYDGHRGFVNYLAVDPEYRRGGFGKCIMEQVEADLMALGCQKINVMIRTRNTFVVEFYRSLGYKEDDVKCMGKRID